MAENKESGGCSHYMAGSMCLLVGISGGEGAKMRLLQRGVIGEGLVVCSHYKPRHIPVCNGII